MLRISERSPGKILKIDPFSWWLKTFIGAHWNPSLHAAVSHRSTEQTLKQLQVEPGQFLWWLACSELNILALLYLSAHNSFSIAADAQGPHASS